MKKVQEPTDEIKKLRNLARKNRDSRMQLRYNVVRACLMTLFYSKNIIIMSKKVCEGHGMRQYYPSDVTRTQFELVRYLLESKRKKTCPPKYDIFCAILYIDKEGCTWRGLPHDFPKWQIVYHYFRLWGKVKESGQSLFEEVMRELVKSERIIKGRNSETTMTITDSKSVQNTDLPEEKGYDAGKNFRYKNTHRNRNPGFTTWDIHNNSGCNRSRWSCLK